MSVNQVININFERNIFNFAGDNKTAQQQLFAAALMEMLQEALDDGNLDAVISAGNSSQMVQALPPWAQKEREMNALIQHLKDEGYYDDNLEDFPIIIDDDLEDFPIIIDDGEKAFHIEAQNYSIDAKIVYEKRCDGFCGPAQFHIEIINAEKK